MSHQVAQKRAITTLPCVSSARTVPPAGVGRLKAGSCVALAGAVRPAGSGGESAADTVRATEVRSAPSIAVNRDCDVVIGPPVSCLMIRQGAYITKHAPAPRCQRRLLFDVYRCTTVTVHANDVLRRAVTDTLDWAMSRGRRLALGFKLRRRLFCIVAAPLLYALSLASPAQSYPGKPIRLVVGFSAGGSADVSARIFAKRIGELLNATIIVENRGGAGGSYATQIVADSNPDGYTLLWGNVGPLTVNPALGMKLGYN